MITAALLIIAKRENLNHPPAAAHIIVYVHTKEHWTAGKLNNLELHAATYTFQNRLKKKAS